MPVLTVEDQRPVASESTVALLPSGAEFRSLVVDVLTGIGNASGLHGFAAGLKVLTKFSCFAERQMATNPYLALLRHFAEDLDKQIKENVLLGTSVNMKLTA